ncbi:hypothetical protein Aduo_019603 [Ancylostoma duodenale]
MPAAKNVPNSCTEEFNVEILDVNVNAHDYPVPSAKDCLVNYTINLLETGNSAVPWEDVYAVLLKYFEENNKEGIRSQAKEDEKSNKYLGTVTVGNAESEDWIYPSRVSTWVISRKSALADALSILDVLCPQKVWLRAVRILREEDKCITLPADYFTGLDHEVERSLAFPAHGGDHSADFGMPDMPKLVYEIIMRSELDTAIISKVVQILWAPNKPPILIGQTAAGFECKMPLDVLKERTDAFNGTLRMEEMPKSLIAELEEGEGNSPTRHNATQRNSLRKKENARKKRQLKENKRHKRQRTDDSRPEYKKSKSSKKDLSKICPRIVQSACAFEDSSRKRRLTSIETGGFHIRLTVLSTMYKVGSPAGVVMDGMLRREVSEKSLCFQEQSTVVDPAIEAERSHGSPAPSVIDKADVEQGEKEGEPEEQDGDDSGWDYEESEFCCFYTVNSTGSVSTVRRITKCLTSPNGLPEIILEEQDDTLHRIFSGAKSKQAASEKVSPTNCHPKVGNPVKCAPMSNFHVKEQSPEGNSDTNRNPLELPVQVAFPREQWVNISEYVAHVAEYGVSLMPWINIRPAFLKFLKCEIRRKVRQHLITNKNSRNAEDAKVLRNCQLVCNRLKKFKDFPSTFRGLCQILTDPSPTNNKLSTFMQAVKELADVNTTASIYIPEDYDLEELKEEAITDEASSIESNHANMQVSDPMPELDGDKDTDNDESSAKGSKGYTHKQRWCMFHQKYDVFPECFPEDILRNKKSKASKKAMSVLK